MIVSDNSKRSSSTSQLVPTSMPVLKHRQVTSRIPWMIDHCWRSTVKKTYDSDEIKTMKIE